MTTTTRLPALLCAGLLLAACAGPQAPRIDPQAVARAEALRSSGYRAAISLAAPMLALAPQRWIVNGEPLPVELALPSGSERGLPLIVYLPGMGESAQAGLPWREAWARAGYAVLSVQPLAADADAWSSELARAADFKGLARERRAPAQLQARLARLRAVLDEARRRAASGDPAWRRVDFARLGLAGYELGTQAVLAGTALGASALLAISPLASASAAPETPLMIVSAEQDRDPTGLIAEPLAASARSSFDGSPMTAHYLLMLGKATHLQLAGSAGEEPEALAERSWRGGGPGGGGRRRQAPATEAPQQHPASGTTRVAIETASTAFWDATLRGRPEARAWLAQDASPWLRGIAVWDQR